MSTEQTSNRKKAAAGLVGKLRTQQDADRAANDDNAALVWNMRAGYLLAGVQVELGEIGSTGRTNIRRIEMRLPPGLSFQSSDLLDAVQKTDGFQRRVSLGQVDVVDAFRGMRSSRARDAVRMSTHLPTLRRLLEVEDRDDVAAVIQKQIELKKCLLVG